MWGLGSTVFVFSTLSHLLSFVHHVRYLACAGSNGTLNIEPVIARISHVSLCAGHGWGPGGSGQGQTNPRPAERAGGTSRGPGPPADQEHICDQVCYRSLVHTGEPVALYALCPSGSTYLRGEDSVVPSLLSQPTDSCLLLTPQLHQPAEPGVEHCRVWEGPCGE